MCQVNWELVPVWIQAIGSLGGLFALIFLWQTLRSQNRTLKEQQRLTDLEHKKFKDSNSPFLNLVKKDFTTNENRNLYVFNIEICVEDNFLTNFQYESTFPEDFKIICDLAYNDSVVSVGTIISFTIEVAPKIYSEYSIDYELSNLPENDIVYKKQIGALTFIFKNKFNDRYTQRVILSKNYSMYLESMKEG